MSAVTWHVYCDLDNDLAFSGAGEDITPWVQSLSAARALNTTLAAGTLTLTLNNASNRFLPSVASGFVVGRRVQVTADIGAATYSVFYGFIEAITPELVTSPDKVVTVTVRDVLKFFALRQAKMTLQIGQTTGALVDLLLDSLGWEGVFTVGLSRLDYAELGGTGANHRVVDVGQTTIPYITFDTGMVAAALRDLVAAECGQLYVRNDGWIVFEDRHHRLKDRAALATITDGHMAALVGAMADEEIYNNVEVTAYPRQVGTPATVVWSARCEDTPQKLATLETKRYYPSYTVNGTEQRCEITAAVTPAASTDYTANDAEDGTGIDRTASVTITVGTESNRDYIEVKNGWTTDVYLTKLQQRATPLIASDQVTVAACDADSVAQYLQRDLPIASRLLSDVGQAQDYANFLLQMNKTPRLNVQSLQLDSQRAEVALLQLGRDIGDLLALSADAYGIDANYFIDGIKLSVDGLGDRITTEWTLSTAPPLFFMLDTDVLDGAMVAY